MLDSENLDEDLVQSVSSIYEHFSDQAEGDEGWSQLWETIEEKLEWASEESEEWPTWFLEPEPKPEPEPDPDPEPEPEPKPEPEPEPDPEPEPEPDPEPEPEPEPDPDPEPEPEPGNKNEPSIELPDPEDIDEYEVKSWDTLWEIVKDHYDLDNNEEIENHVNAVVAYNNRHEQDLSDKFYDERWWAVKWNYIYPWDIIKLPGSEQLNEIIYILEI